MYSRIEQYAESNIIGIIMIIISIMLNFVMMIK